MHRVILLFAWIVVFVPACSDKKHSKNAEHSTESEGASQDAIPTIHEEDPIVHTDDPLFQLGMPQYCALERKGDEGCFSCTPRELPLMRCHKIQPTFDAAEDCRHDLDEMTCNSIEFVWNFNERNHTEAMYERLPVVSILIKNLLASKLKDHPEKIEHASAVVDLISTYRLEIFTGKDLDKVASEGIRLFKKIRPDTEINDAEVSEALKGIMSTLAKKAAHMEINEGDLLQVLAGMFNQLPAELGDFVGLLDQESLLETESPSQTEETQENL